MDLDDERESSNVEDLRGQGGGGFGFPGGGGGLNFGGGKLGCGGLAIVVVLALVFGVNPLSLLGGGGGGGGPPAQIGQPVQVGEATPGAKTDMDRFVSRVLASTEDTWAAKFQQEVGQAYQPPKLALFTGQVRSGCGAAESAMGPFYCPADQKVYLDQTFFDELSRRFGAPGDFAAAYVIAHEVGHHIQTLLGVSEQVQQAQSRASKREGNALQVRMELQADCLAGVWAKANSAKLEPGDVEEAMRAATAIGDDTLQRAAQGVVVPESFTHGSSAQRTTWFMRGLKEGTIAACDTFRSDI